MCCENSRQRDFGDFPLADTPSILLNVLTNYGVDVQTLARLEATCTFFRRAAQLYSDCDLPLLEIAALDMCSKKAIFKRMTNEERADLKKICGGSWKFVLRFILAGEACNRKEKALAVAGPGYSIVVAQNGDVYSFGCNIHGQLGIGTLRDQAKPCHIRSIFPFLFIKLKYLYGGNVHQSRSDFHVLQIFQGIRIIQESAALGRTILISDAGSVYSCGKQAWRSFVLGNGANNVLTPKQVESLEDIFVVQAAVGTCFTAFLSREGRVYTVAWGKIGKLDDQTDFFDSEPRPVHDGLENAPVVQIAAGYNHFLALACQPSGMSVYSVGCGLDGKLEHGNLDDEPQPQLIEKFQTLELQPMMLAAGMCHYAVVGVDGRVCTWGRGDHGCLGHGDEEFQSSPKVVSALANVKAVHVAAGDYTTFVVTEDGDLYSFGQGKTSCLGREYDNPADAHQAELRPPDFLIPKLVTSLKKLNEHIVHMSVASSAGYAAHALAITKSGKLYTFGRNGHGQLGIGHDPDDFGDEGIFPELVNIDLS